MLTCSIFLVLRFRNFKFILNILRIRNFCNLTCLTLNSLGKSKRASWLTVYIIGLLRLQEFFHTLLRSHRWRKRCCLLLFTLIVLHFRFLYKLSDAILPSIWCCLNNLFRMILVKNLWLNLGRLLVCTLHKLVCLLCYFYNHTSCQSSQILVFSDNICPICTTEYSLEAF